MGVGWIGIPGVFTAQELTIKKSQFSKTQILPILKDANAGQMVEEICRKQGISSIIYM